MPHIKTAVSIQEPVYKAATKTARILKISRSQLFEQALTDYLIKIDNNRLLVTLNAVYQSPTDREATGVRDYRGERDYLASMKRLAGKRKTKRW